MRKKVYSILLGIGAGLIMAVILLYIMISTGFILDGFEKAVVFVIAGALPSVLQIFYRNDHFSIFLSQMTMIIVSLVITLIYGVYVSNASILVRTYADNRGMAYGFCELHAISLVVTVLVYLLQKKRKRK